MLIVVVIITAIYGWEISLKNLLIIYGEGKGLLFFDKNSININCESPKYITLSIESGCNVKCVFCRDDVVFVNKEETARLKNLIDTNYFIPLLKNTEVITLNGAGEIFVSKFCKLFIEKVVKKYPKIRFEILTNGLLCNEKTLKEFKLINKINEVTISLHAAKEKTYDKMVRGSNFKTVLKNIEYISSLKKKKKINELYLCFVITSINYKELPDFVKLAYSFNAVPLIWEVRPYDFDNCKLIKEIEKYDVTRKEHPEHEKFLKVLQDPIMKDFPIAATESIIKENKEIKKYFKAVDE